MKQAQKAIKFFVVFLTMLSALSILAKDPAQAQDDIFYSIAKQYGNQHDRLQIIPYNKIPRQQEENIVLAARVV